MFNPNSLFQSLFVIPILNILIFFYKLFLLMGLPGALGFALIVLTVLIRLILHPLTVSQLKSAHKVGKLKPLLDKLSQQHKNDKQRLFLEQSKLYKEAGVNPAGGCLPLIVQMPILIALYNLFFQLLNNGNLNGVIEEINKVVYHSFLRINSLDLSFFGIQLATKPTEWQKYGWWLLAIPVITGVLQYWQTKMMTPAQAVKPKVEEEKNEAKEKEKKNEDMSSVMQKQMGVMMPIMIGYFAYTFPLGLSLYWNANTVFGIIQQYYLLKHLEHGK